MCDMTEPYMWHDCSHLCDLTHQYTWHVCFHMCDVTHPSVWQDSSISVTWLIHMCDMTHPYMCHDSGYTSSIKPWHREYYAMLSRYICVTWLIYMCDMTHPYVRHDSSMCVPWLRIHISGQDMAQRILRNALSLHASCPFCRQRSERYGLGLSFSLPLFSFSRISVILTSIMASVCLSFSFFPTTPFLDFRKEQRQKAKDCSRKLSCQCWRSVRSKTYRCAYRNHTCARWCSRRHTGTSWAKVRHFRTRGFICRITCSDSAAQSSFTQCSWQSVNSYHQNPWFYCRLNHRFRASNNLE